MPHPQKQSSKRRRAVSGFILDDGTIAELVFAPLEERTSLLVAHGQKWEAHTEWKLPGGEVVVPVPPANNLLRHRAVLLPETPAAFESIASLVAEIESHITRYVDLSPAFLAIVSHYILLSWVYDAFNELPYLRLRGEPGSGKTRALIVIGSLCYRAFFASGASTVSPIFHTLDTFRGTLIFDEADFRFSDEKAELVKIFNNGNVKGFPVFRAVRNSHHEFDPTAFHVFGPKIVAMRERFQDRALESRFITEEMGQRTMRFDIPINLPDCQQDEALALRNKLLRYRLRHLRMTKVDPSLVDPRLSSRLNQILVPLLSVMLNKATRVQTLAAASVLDRIFQTDRQATSEAQLLEVLAAAFAEIAGAAIPLGDITARFIQRFGTEHERPITPRYVGSLLRNRLHLTSYKSHGLYVIPRSEAVKVEVLCQRFGITPAF